MVNLNYPPVGFRFSVSLGPDPVDAAFAEVTGISTEVTTEEVIEGGENRFKHRLPSTINHPPLVLKRGMAVPTSELVAWVLATFADGVPAHIVTRQVIVSLLDEMGLPLIAWNFVNCYPLKYEISGLKADQNQIAIESIELNYQYLFQV